MMREVYIKYNPYKLRTEILVDNEVPKEGSNLNNSDKRLQEWIDNLPEILMDEYRTKNFNVTFYGTAMDYEDVKSVLDGANTEGFKFTLNWQKGEGNEEKEERIKEIFEKIQHGPFDNLRSKELAQDFKAAMDEEFKINVIATMSSGKSTLVNALLGRNLMPAKNEACTAVITEIKDCDGKEFSGESRDKDDNRIKSYEVLDLDTMRELNENENVRTIKIEGDIPFTKSEEIKLVLVDTPGPNNSRDEQHQLTTYEQISGTKQAKPPLVLYILNATQLSTNDDNALLNYVAEKMKEGRQGKDRFFFVVNKLDQFDENDDLNIALQKVREYLKKHGIETNNIFPASALTALEIRNNLKERNLYELINMSPRQLKKENLADTIARVMQFIYPEEETDNSEKYYFEKYVQLPERIKNDITEDVVKAEKIISDETNSDEVLSEAMKNVALIHCGIRPLEIAIDMYIRKYAKTAKINDMVSSFASELERSGNFEETKKAILLDKGEKEKVVNEIKRLEKLLADGKGAKAYEDKVNALDFKEGLSNVIDKKIAKLNKNLRETIENLRGDKEISEKEASRILDSLINSGNELEAQVAVEMNAAIKSNIVDAAHKLLKEYKEHLSELINELKVQENITVDPFDWVTDSVNMNVNDFIQIKKIEKIRRIKNPNKSWWQFWKDSYINERYTQKEKYIEVDNIFRTYLAQVTKNVMQNKDMALKYSEEQSTDIKATFKKYFEELDKNIQQKSNELINQINDKEHLEENLARNQKKLDWLNKIKQEIDSALEI